MADFEKDSDQQISVKVGAKVIVINKDESGKTKLQRSRWVGGEKRLHIRMHALLSHTTKHGALVEYDQLFLNCLNGRQKMS